MIFNIKQGEFKICNLYLKIHMFNYELIYL